MQCDMHRAVKLTKSQSMTPVMVKHGRYLQLYAKNKSSTVMLWSYQVAWGVQWHSFLYRFISWELSAKYWFWHQILDSNSRKCAPSWMCEILRCCRRSMRMNAKLSWLVCMQVFNVRSKADKQPVGAMLHFMLLSTGCSSASQAAGMSDFLL